MNDKRNCIICNQTKKTAEFSEEHIIPESLGNKLLKIYVVCKKCNDLMGAKIDSELVNNEASQMFRQLNNISGQKGYVPHPFEHGKTQDGRDVRLDRNFKPHIVKPDISVSKTGDNQAYISYSGDNDLDSAIKAMNKKLERSGLPKLTEAHIAEIREQAQVTSEIPSLNYSWNVNFAKLQLAYMKIAYEYGYYLWGYDYTCDPVANEIRDRINKCIYNDIIPDDLDNYARWDTFDVSHMVDPLLDDNYKDFEYRHIIVSTGSKCGIIAGIILFPNMHCSVRYCSDDSRFYNFRIFVANYPKCKLFEM